MYLLLPGCGSAPKPADPQKAAGPLTAGSERPLGLSKQLPYPDFPLDAAAPGRSTAATETVSIPGSQYLQMHGSRNFKGSGTETSYTLVSSLGSCAWAQYETAELGPARPRSLHISAAAAGTSNQSTELLPLKYWVALADYRLGRWQWLGPFSAPASISLDTVVFSQRHYSPAGRLHVAVFTYGGLLKSCAVKIQRIEIEPGGLPESLERISNAANFTAALQQPQGLDGDFNFIVIGDMRDGEETYIELLNQAAAYDPAFVVNTGDIVPHGYTEEIEAYAALLDRYEVPILSVPGNHDIASGPENYTAYFGSSEWTFDYGGCRIVGLDNANGKFSEAGLSYAKAQLPTAGLCFAALHKPPYLARWEVHGMLPDERGSNMSDMLDIIAGSSTDAVFLGHIHLYDEMQIGGIPWIISGGGGSPLAGKYGFGKAEFGFVVVQVKDGAFTYVWVKKTS